MTETDGAPNLGAQWAERRGGERLLTANPIEQAKGAKFLLHLLTSHEEFGPKSADSREVAAAFRVVLINFIDRYPDFLTQQITDADVGGELYVPDPQLVDILHNTLNSSPKDDQN